MDLLDLVALSGEQALEYRRMLRINGQDHGPVTPHRTCDQLSGRDKGLLVGERHYLAGFKRRKRRPQAAEPNHRPHNDVDGRHPHKVAQAVNPRPYLEPPRLKGVRDLAVSGIVTDHHIRGVKLYRLADKQIGASARRYQLHLKEIRMLPYHIKRLGADRAGRAKYSYLSFQNVVH